MTASKVRNLTETNGQHLTEANEQRPTSLRVSTVNQSESQTMPKLAKILQSSTSLALALVGCILGVTILLTGAEETTMTAGFGVASTVIAGAAGLAQANSRED